ncbi:ABC transporter substrate-binding protein [Geodermatophilus sabuli]|uniref:NitT/TauT family transport system substrate-binding protein n=1 Tax=Geodermatophilus sabuli TaxID=1564158 RepID=A0A285EAC5_9ACTN|nr:ABC transporter substrate-binding protein [Geodermatophilus sabuli]MBB3085488.1 NitT/TauT family transport system substrate-binding protein [Geodermatophilus sabuli]SNX96088.1 NitT/TauT family transport system substrate-binding protein [Geodermatophilus sabuli]
MKLRGAIAGATALAVLGLAACGSDDDSAAGGSGGSADGGLETTEITVGALPLADYSALYWAQEKGFFEKEGLTVTLEPVQGGPQAAQSVAAGELDVSFSNTISTSIATQRGLPIKTVVLTSALGPGGLSVYVKPDSPIQTLEDLDGATVGINATNNIGDVTLRNLLNSEGLEDVEPTFVEVPFPEMAAGVEAGSIDAGYSPEPFSSAALAAGMREVVDLTDPAGPNVGLAVSNFIASDQYIQENPNTVAAFARAMYAAGQDIEANEGEFRAWLPSIAKLPEDVAQNMALPDFLPETDVDEIQRVVDVLVEQELLEEGYDPAEFTYVPEG